MSVIVSSCVDPDPGGHSLSPGRGPSAGPADGE